MTETYGVHLEMNPQALGATVRADGMNLYGKLKYHSSRSLVMTKFSLIFHLKEEKIRQFFSEL